MFYEARSSFVQLQRRQPAGMKQDEMWDKTQVPGLALPCPSCVTLGKSLNFSELQCPSLKTGIRIISSQGLQRTQ